MSHFFVPNRIWWNTTGVLALYSERPLLANVYFMVKLNAKDERTSIEFEKALTVWFTSVWGIMFVLLNREETRGPFTRLNTGQWKLLPVLDVTKLTEEVLSKISRIFDEFKSVEFRYIHEQFSDSLEEVDCNRLRLDLEFLKALDPKIDEILIRNSLLDLYGKLRGVLDKLIAST
jgi:hypothetical protein